MADLADTVGIPIQRQPVELSLDHLVHSQCGRATADNNRRSHYKCWRTTGVLGWAALLFTGGFIAREIAAFDDGNLVKLLVSVILVYAAP